MSQTKKKDNYSDKLEKRKKAVLGKSAKNHKPLILTLALLILAVAGAVAYLGFDPPESASTAHRAGAPAPASVVNYPTALFDDGRARHFEYRHAGLTVRYFILKSADGVLRAAFDACDVCWPAGKGYFQAGDQMVCRNCGRKFDSVRVNEVKGGCNPAPLNRTVSKDRLVIQVSDILRGRSYFDFSGKGTTT